MSAQQRVFSGVRVGRKRDRNNRARGQSRWKALLLWGLGLAVALVIHLPVLVAAQTASATDPVANRPEHTSHASELRGVWLTNIDSDVLFSRDNLDRAIQRLSRLNFNTLYPTIWNGGYTLYPSKVAAQWTDAPVDPTPEFKDRDMLAETIELAHDKGLAVIPWFELGLMAPEDSELAKRHPDWIMSRKDGTQVFLQGEHGEHRFVWFNPVHPDVQKMLTDLVIEVATRYNIDGIQFDDHFGTPIELGYDDYTVKRYQQDHNGRRPPDDLEDPEWMRWRSTNVSTMMVKIFAALKTRKPNCLISLAPNPKEFSYRRYLQDWASWVRLKFIDELVIQVYRTDRNSFVHELDKADLQAIRAQVPVAIGILTGLRILPVDMQQIETQVSLTRDRQFAGFSFFFYETLGDRDNDFLSLLSQPASRPNVRNYTAGL